MAQSAFANLYRWSLPSKIGLDMEKCKFSTDYTYVEIKWSGEGVLLSDESLVTEAKKGQSIRLIPATNVKKTDFKEKVLIVVNPELAEVAQAPSTMLLETAAGDTINLIAHFRKDSNLANLTWLLRLYVVG